MQRLTLEPETVDAGALEPLRAAGLSDDAIRDAIVVAAAFNLIDRVADALAFEPLSHTLSREQVLELEGRALLEHGYA